jgi:hypothetical protein
MPISHLRAMEDAPDKRTLRKMILPAFPVDPATGLENIASTKPPSVPTVVASPRSKNPQALEAEIVRLNNQRNASTPEPVAEITDTKKTAKFASSGYRPLHLAYQVPSHAMIGGADFGKKRGLSALFAWQDILIFFLVALCLAVITGSVLLIYV